MAVILCVWQNMLVYCYGWILVKTPFVDGGLLLAYRKKNNLRNPCRVAKLTLQVQAWFANLATACCQIA